MPMVASLGFGQGGAFLWHVREDDVLQRLRVAAPTLSSWQEGRGPAALLRRSRA